MFRDRKEAGKKLARLLGDLESSENTIVLGLARGGVIIAREIAAELHLPLDVLMAKKIGAPGNPEFALGAVVDSIRILDYGTINRLDIPREYMEGEIAHRTLEAKQQMRKYRQGRPIFNLRHKRVILADDGIATGSTMSAAIAFARSRKAEEIIVAVPLAPEDTLDRLRPMVDRIECLVKTGPHFSAVGEYYEYFPQVSDEEVQMALRPYAHAGR